MDRRFVLRWTLLLVLLLVGILLGTRFLALPWVVAGPSMEPTLRPGDRVIVDVWTYRQRRPRPGEVAVLRGAGPGQAHLVKRVVPAPDPTRARSGGQAGLWVEGDNPGRSLDSRRFGPVPAERLVGRVVWRYWPPSRAGPIR